MIEFQREIRRTTGYLSLSFISSLSILFEDFRIAADMDHKLASVIIKRFYN